MNKNVFNKILSHLLVVISCITSMSVFAQTLVPNIINEKGTSVYSFNSINQQQETLEDWHYGGMETDEGDFVFTTRIEQTDPSVNGHREYPGLIKYDRYFNVKWHQFLKPGAYTKIAPFGIPAVIDSAIIEGAEIHTKVIETNDGYLAFGYYYQGSKIFVMKVDKQGNISPNFPRIFDYYTTHTYQINDIAFVSTSNFTGYMGVGQKNNQMAIFKFDEQLENLTTTMVGNGTNIDGELFGMCLLYPNGSSSRDVPKVSNEEPTGIAFTGWSDKGNYYPTFVSNFNVYYGAANISLSTINYYKLDHYDNQSSLNTSIPQFNQLDIEPATNPELTYNFKGYDICQTQNGDIGGLELWNYMYLTGNNASNTDRKNGNAPSGSNQLIAGDVHVRELKFNPTNFTLDTFFSGNNQKVYYLAHSSGSDYYPRIALDNDDDFIVLTNNADHPNTVTNHYFLMKVDRGNNNLEWYSRELGIGPSGICPFELIVTKNGRYITAGNNYNEFNQTVPGNEDLDIALWGSGCQANAVQNATEFISNVPNGHDFSVQQWSSVTPGNPTTMQIGGSGVVGSRIIVEPGFTLKFLGGQGVDLQFPHVEEFAHGIASSPEPLKNIVVYPSGKVIIENGVTLRGVGECGGSWEGIELMPSGLGMTKAELLMGSAEIKEAITGIKSNQNTKISIGSSQNSDAKFTNCRTGVEMQNDFFTTSKIIKAKFDYQQAVEEGFNEGLDNHIYLNSINGLNIWGTQFINSDSASNFVGNYRGTGIQAINSNFNVLKNQWNVSNVEECQPPAQTEPPCLFRELSVGIDATYLQPNYYLGYPIKVLNNRFEDCRHAMHFGNGNSIIVFENEIIIGDINLGKDPIYPLDINYGISTLGTSQFEFIQNDIQINDLNRFTHGIYIENSDNLNIMSPSLIYKNTTTALSYQSNKNIALKVNEASSNLKINCNTNTNVSTDWSFNPYTNITCIGSSSLEAGNKFAMEDLCTNNPQTDAYDWYFGESITYYSVNSCVGNYRHFPKAQQIAGISPPPQISPGITLDNNCLDSSSCHISRWTNDLSTNFGGSVVYFPPIPPPNSNYNERNFNDEYNRVIYGFPLIDSNPGTTLNPEIKKRNSEAKYNAEVKLYPNPISTEFPILSFTNISLPLDGLKIYNMGGQELEFKQVDEHSVELKNVSEGIYVARIFSNNQTFSIKFIVTK